MAKTNTLMAQELVQEIEVYKERLVQTQLEHKWLAYELYLRVAKLGRLEKQALRK